MILSDYILHSGNNHLNNSDTNNNYNRNQNIDNNNSNNSNNQNIRRGRVCKVIKYYYVFE